MTNVKPGLRLRWLPWNQLVAKETADSSAFYKTTDLPVANASAVPRGHVDSKTGYGLDNGSSRVLFSAGAGNFFLHRVQTDSGTHPASYPVSTGGSFPGVKAAGA
jgi:hypothetical protein